jgi:hypothetical protein
MYEHQANDARHREWAVGERIYVPHNILPLVSATVDQHYCPHRGTSSGERDNPESDILVRERRVSTISWPDSGVNKQIQDMVI